MKYFYSSALITILFLAGCATPNTNNGKTETPTTSNDSQEMTITGTYFTPQESPNYVMITPSNPNINGYKIDHISPTNLNVLTLFNIPNSEERGVGCSYLQGKVTVTIKNLKEFKAASPSTSPGFNAEIVKIKELGEANCS